MTCDAENAVGARLFKVACSSLVPAVALRLIDFAALLNASAGWNISGDEEFAAFVAKENENCKDICALCLQYIEICVFFARIAQ